MTKYVYGVTQFKLIFTDYFLEIYFFSTYLFKLILERGGVGCLMGPYLAEPKVGSSITLRQVAGGDSEPGPLWEDGDPEGGGDPGALPPAAQAGGQDGAGGLLPQGLGQGVQDLPPQLSRVWQPL